LPIISTDILDAEEALGEQLEYERKNKQDNETKKASINDVQISFLVNGRVQRCIPV